MDYVAGMEMPKQHESVVRRAAEEFDQRALLPTLRDVTVFWESYGIDAPAPKSRTSSVPRLFTFFVTMSTAELERVLNKRLFSGPAKLGPIAAAIRQRSKYGRRERIRMLVEQPMALRPHVVLLGAGASRAAFPRGDASSRPVPLMHDLVEILNIRPTIGSSVLQSENFEAFYSRMADDPQQVLKKKEIEQRVETYFSSLSLPEEVTIYDRILLSLRPEDAVFTFNWDPFLFDAYTRNRDHGVELPCIFFLHGNVRIGRCRQHADKWGGRHMVCPVCNEPFSKVPLLYPLEDKNYSKNSYISRSWDAARSFFKNAFTVTVFGYSAPDADGDAVGLLKSAWFEDQSRKMEHFEVIDVLPKAQLQERWGRFTPTDHLVARSDFQDSWMAMWPRRAREGLFQAMSNGIPCEHFPLSDTKDLAKLQAQALRIANWEETDVSGDELSP